MKKILCLLILLITISATSLFASAKDKFVHKLPTDVNLINALDHWENLPAVSTAAVANSISISTQTLVADTTAYTLALGDITDIVFLRSITADAYFATGEDTTTVVGILTVTGVDQFGRSQTETLVISTTAVAGVKVWSTISQLAFTGFAISGASEATVSLSVGSGLQIALSNNVYDSDDITKVIEAGATSTSYTLDTTNDAITFASAPNGSQDYYIYYNSRTDTSRYNY